MGRIVFEEDVMVIAGGWVVKLMENLEVQCCHHKRVISSYL